MRNLLVLSLVLLSSCAGMGIGGDEEKELDPIAAVALSLRQGRHPAYAREPATEADLQERQTQLRSAIAQREVLVGMDMRQVTQVLGRPYDIESAGDPGQGNQRWVYPLGLSGRFGLGAQRVIYFEDGKLVGWENRASR
jgi:hypothetical protein